MKTKLLFWGTGAIAVPTFERLLTMADIHIVGVITQADAPSGRHQELTAPPIKTIATRHNIPVFQPTTLKDEALFETINALQPDVALVFAYGKIIPQRFLDIPKKGTLNVHPSLLPHHRGPTPVHATILNGDKEGGVTLILLDAEMDHGPIVAQTTLRLNGDETTETLSATLADRSATLVAETLPKYLAGDISPKEQDHDAATYCKILDRDSGRIDWSLPAETILRMARAYTPWPGIWTTWTDGTQTLRVKLFLPTITTETLPSGTLQQQNEKLLIGTGSTALAVTEIQVEGKKRLAVSDILRGNQKFLQGHFVS